MFTIGKEYSLDNVDNFIYDSFRDVKTVRNHKSNEYFNCPCAFDIETSNFEQNGEKVAIMYEWTLGINGNYIIGRTWAEFIATYKKIVEIMEISADRRLIIYVHNLDFEFAFMQYRLKWANVFSIAKRKPIYAVTTDGVEFRCSHKLSNYSLAKLGEQLVKYKVQKQVGDLDYSLLRHSQTPLTEKERGYCIADVLVVMCYIQERIEDDGNILRVPLTNTGYVRKHCQRACLHGGASSHKKSGYTYLKFRRMISKLTLDPIIYAQCKRAFQGGFVHANVNKSGKTLKKVASFDEVSAYPAMMVAKKYPMGAPQRIVPQSRDHFEQLCATYCCMFDIRFKNIESIKTQERYISLSKCWEKVEVQEDNGRVISAKVLSTTITEQDYYIIKRFYRWDDMQISNFTFFRKAYLPTPLVQSILQLYKDKTELKGIEGKEVEYLNSKGKLNACYGMMVTEICRDEIIFDDGWRESEPCNIDETIDKYNKSLRRFLYYPWGVWVTAYARVAIFQAIDALGEDYAYSDTDSAKFLHYHKHVEFFERYNKYITKELENACKFHKLDVEMIRPKNKKGEEKPLGIFEYEGYYQKFKTLGCKRYAYKKKGKYNIVVAGLGKQHATPYIKSLGNFFDHFDVDLYVPEEYTGKLTHEYIDEVRRGYITDYQGNRAPYEELSSVHLSGCEYTLSITEKYLMLIMDGKESDHID